MIDQAVIGICGVTAIFLSQDPEVSRRRWACVFGLAAQPAWFYTTWNAEQYGIFCLSFFYAYAWARGVRTYWLRPANG